MSVPPSLRRGLLILAACALMPTAALAQQNDNPNEGTPGAEQASPTSQGRPSAAGLCGSESTMPSGRSSLAIAPTGEGDAKDVTGAQRLDLSEVQGMIEHMEGDLALIRLAAVQMTPAAGGSQQTQWAVVRLPADCLTGEFATGSSVLVVGTQGSDGILVAESMQPAS